MSAILILAWMLMGHPGIADRWLLIDAFFRLAALLAVVAMLIGLFFVRGSKWARMVTAAAFLLFFGQSLYAIRYLAPHWLGWATGFQCQTVGKGPIAPAGHIQSEMARRLDVCMEELCRKGFAGVVLVAKNDRIELCKGYGYADKTRHVPFDQETVFDIGSVTKQFTAAAVLKLQMLGKLTVEDKITRFLESVPPDKSQITVHQLLTHTSGLSEGFGGDYDPMSRDQIVAATLKSKLDHQPGEVHAYSNAGYSLLGAIIEVVSGQPYEEFLQVQLLGPAGMMQTGYKFPQWPKEKLSHGYTLTGFDWGTPLDQPWADDGPSWNLRANGGILSTVGDLFKWHRALKGEAILSTEAKTKLFHPHVREEEGSDSFYGYGWTISQTRSGTKVITHNGSNAIFYADFRWYVDDDILFVIASNQTAHMAYFHQSEILTALLGSSE